MGGKEGEIEIERGRIIGSKMMLPMVGGRVEGGRERGRERDG